MALPICSRCVARSLPCKYKPRKRNIPSSEGTLSLQADDSTSSIPDRTNGEAIMNSDSLSMFPDDPTTLLDIGNEPTLADDMLMNDFLQVYDNRLYSEPQLSVGVMDRERIRYCIRQLRSLPEKLVQQGKNSFIHPQAYQPLIPNSLQDASCAAALYLQKNEANEAVMWEIISTKARQLLQHGYSSLSDHLASLQALIILQIIRIFDGEIRPRADAEQQEETLTAWTKHLVQRTEVNASPGSLTANSWESWVFEETIARTVIISLMVQAMFAIQKEGFCTLVNAVTELSFTASKKVWDAPSAQHWKKALNESSRYHVPFMDFTEVLAQARPDDVGDLGMLMLVTYKGVERVNEWIMETGNGALIY